MSKNVWNLQRFICLVVCVCAFAIFGTVKVFTRNLVNNKNVPSLLKDQSLFAYRLLGIGEDNGTDSSNISNVTECRNRTIDEFPKDFLNNEERNNGGIIAHVAITFYLFGALAIVCNEYFEKSLALISKDLKLKPDVAGATFMAAGSSAPELFTSIIGVTIAKSDIGLGAIVGSAVFNILFIIGLCALAAKTTLNLDWYPLTRDCICYCVSIGALITVLYDGKVYWYESVILLTLYLFYILVMYFNNSIEKNLKLNVNQLKYYQQEEATMVDDTDDADETAPLIRPNSLTKMNTFDGFIDPNKQYDYKISGDTSSTTSENVLDDDDDEDNEPVNPFEKPYGAFKTMLWLIFLPVSVLFYLTIPDSRRKIFSKFPFYFITFLISILYLSVLSYVLVWMVVIIAYTVDLPDTVVGLTLLAAGTSLPEVVLGIIVTRKGQGDMAISNSIGSNIFDIFICLGLPWFLTTVIIEPNTTVKIYSGGIAYSAIILLSTVVGLLLLTWLNKFQLNKKFGALLLLFWVIVTVLTCLFELNVFGNYSIPTCK